jgi:3-hydroxyisobutyrate dehydrogenase-like beta-hydroxyacid dehydrogenase
VEAAMLHDPSSSMEITAKSEAEVREGKANTGPDRRFGSIGFVGLGRMGTAMAAGLAAAGRDVTAFVRRPGQVTGLCTLGVVPTLSLADLAESEIVVSMLPDDAAVREVFFGRGNGSGLADLLPATTIHLSMSTISTAASSEFAGEHAARGQFYVAAPVFGNPDAAWARQLFIVLAGPTAQSEHCRMLVEPLGQTYIAGTDPTQAHLIKLLGNMMTATTLEVLGEVVAVLKKSGQDPQQFVDIMTSTMFGSRVHKIYGNRIVAEDYKAGLALPLALKDVRLALAEAEKAGVPTPTLGVVRDRLIAGIARGYAELDWTGLALVAAEEAGVRSLTPA